MFDLGSVVAHFKADTSEFEKSVGKMQSKTTGFAEKSVGFSKKFAIGLGIMTTAAVAFGVKSAKAFNEAERRGTALTKLILNQKGATMDNVNALKDQASQLSKNTAIDKTSIIAAQAKLATFDLQSEAIKKLIPSLLDMQAGEEQAVPTTESLVNAANGLGKALQGNTELFTKQGFVITETQREILKTGNETQRLAVINEVLGKTYEGAAEAMGNTFSGRLQKLSNLIGDFKEAVGGLIAGALSPVIQKFLDWVEAAGGVDQIISNLGKTITDFWNKPEVQNTLQWFKDLYTELVKHKDIAIQVKDSIENLLTSLGKLVKAFGNFSENEDVKSSEIIIKSIGGAVMLVGKAIAFMNNQLAGAIDLLATVIQKLKEFKQKSDEARANQGLFGKIAGGIGNVMTFGLGSLLRAAGGPVMANQPYIVGENGPEWFVPKVTGTVLPNGTQPSSSAYNVVNNVSLNTPAAVYAFKQSMRQETIAAKFGLPIA